MLRKEIADFAKDVDYALLMDALAKQNTVRSEGVPERSAMIKESKNFSMKADVQDVVEVNIEELEIEINREEIENLDIQISINDGEYEDFFWHLQLQELLYTSNHFQNSWEFLEQILYD